MTFRAPRAAISAQGLSKTLIGLVAVATAAPAAAECLSSWRICQDVAITRLVTDRNGANGILVSGNTNNLTCTPQPGGYLKLDMTASKAESVYAHILALHLQGKRANIRLDDHETECTIVYLYTDQ